MLRKILILQGISSSILIAMVVLGCSNRAVSEKSEKLAGTNLQEEVELENSLGQRADWGNAPDFTLPRLEGGMFTLSSLKDKVIILDFWATWCPPCRKEIPDYIDLYQRYKDKGLEIVGVLLDRAKKSRLKSFIEEMGISYINVLGNNKVTQKYGNIRAIPTTFIIDTNGNIVEKYVGFTSKETFENKISELLDEGSK